MRRKGAPTATPCVLLAIPSSGSDGRERLSGIFRYMGEGHSWRLIMPSLHLELTAASLRELLRTGLDGAIISARYDPSIARIISEEHLPTILMHDSWMHRPHVGADVRFSLTNHIAVGRMAARHFLSLGRFAAYIYVGDTERNRWGRARRMGFERELASHALMTNAYTPAPSSQRLLDRDRFCSWLRKRPAPLAIFAANDRIAVQVLECCRSLGYAIPADVAILGVDNDETLISAYAPALSSIMPDFAGAGYAAAKMLDELLAGKKTAMTRIFPPVRLVERASTAPLSPSVKLVEAALAYIDSHPTENLSPFSLAGKLHVSRALLDLRFRELKRGGVAALIRQRRLDEVKRLLRETNLTLRQICHQCGFTNERSLQNMFRRTFGAPAGSFRT